MKLDDSAMERNSNRKKIAIHIDEDHNESLGRILGAAGSKRIPIAGNVLVHFDSHPDLLLPKDLTAEECRNRRSVMDAVSIENWILPAAYLGVVSKIAWVRPAWSGQIRDGLHRFKIGHTADDGEERVRVTCLESYFFSEGIVCREEDLLDARDVELLVVELGSDDCIARLRDFAGPEFLLDIDLDFYSTRNPFLNMYERADMYQKLKRIYTFRPVPEILQGDERLKFALETGRARSELLRTLESMFDSLAEGNLLDLPEEEDSKELWEQVTELRRSIELNYPGERVDWRLVHDAGCTWDDTELPHHVSTPGEIAGMLTATRRALGALPRPRLVTVARSSLDDYCPPEQVDSIQQGVVSALEEKIEEELIEMHFNYCAQDDE